jgi:flavin reductase (DIM6/NTAB) family NADH-FMN oxidoreductase RutF
MNQLAAASLFARLDREVWLLTAQAAERRGGLIATFVSPASIVPHLPRVLVGLAKQHFTTELVEASGAFVLHLLAERQLDRVWRFGMHSSRTQDKLEGLQVATSTSGSPLLADCAGWLDCRVEARLDCGDRLVYLAEVLTGETTSTAPPLTTRRVLAAASPEQLAELKRQRTLDSEVDAAAILAWRARLAEVGPCSDNNPT